jgi:hypothetical protein
MSKLSLLWTKHIKDPAKKAEFESTIRSSRTALDRLTEIIDHLTEELSAKEANFDDPNWPYRQANLIGQRQAYKTIRKLIER